MRRIAPVSDDKQRLLNEIFELAASRMSFLPNDGLIMAHKPAILRSFFGLVKAVYAEGKIDGGLKRMIGHISSKANGCDYCSVHTAYEAYQQGIPEEKLKALWSFNTSTLFSDAEKAALNFTLKSSHVPNQVIDDDFKVLKEYYDDEAIVEMVSIIAMFGFLNRWNTTFNTPLELIPETFYQSLTSIQNE